MSHGGMQAFNTNDGYAEAMFRGYRMDILKPEEYSQITSSGLETLDDLKQALQSLGTPDTSYNFSPYGKDFLADKTSQSLDASDFVVEAKARLILQFEHVRAQAMQPLATFLDYTCYSYMIDNILLLLRGSINGKRVEDLLKQCNPLGKFEAMAAVAACESPEELYTTVLIDAALCPVGKYFSAYMEQMAAGKGAMGGKDMVSAAFTNESIEVVRNVLYKAYIEDFSELCAGLGEVTAQIMGDILDFEADRRVISMTLNLLDMVGGDENNPEKPELLPLFPRLGKLFTTGGPTKEMVFSEIGSPDQQMTAAMHDAIAKARTRDAVEEQMRKITEYSLLVDEKRQNPDASYDTLFYKYEAKVNQMAFENQMHYGVFYAFLKLREQEIRNIEWIANCIEQRQLSRINDYIKIFDK